MGNTLRGKTVLVVGRGSGIARAITLLAQSEGARVVVAGRDKAKLADAYDDVADPGMSAPSDAAPACAVVPLRVPTRYVIAISSPWRGHRRPW